MMVEHRRNGRRHHADAAKTSRPPRTKVADLVLSGGGVKGIGLVGAVVALMEAGYRIGRISGTSAGSLVGAVMAAAFDATGSRVVTASANKTARIAWAVLTRGETYRSTPEPRAA